jgi:hypothetical protein
MVSVSEKMNLIYKDGLIILYYLLLFFVYGALIAMAENELQRAELIKMLLGFAGTFGLALLKFRHDAKKEKEKTLECNPPKLDP